MNKFDDEGHKMDAVIKVSSNEYIRNSCVTG